MFKRAGIRTALFLGDMGVLALALLLASWLRPFIWFGRPLSAENAQLGWPVYLIGLVIWAGSFLLLNVYNLQKNLRLADELQHLTTAHAAATLAFAGALYFSFRDVSRLQVLTFAMLAFVCLIIWRSIIRLILRAFGDRRYGARRVLIVGAGSVGREVARMVLEHRWTGLRLIGFLDDNPQADTAGQPHLGPLSQILAVIETQLVNEVIFTLPRRAHHQLANLVAQLQAYKINVRVVPDFFDLVFLRSVVEDFGGMPLVTLREPALDPLQRLIKRLFDLLLGALLLAPALPVMAVIALIIRLDSPGPVFFTQPRLGENGRVFKMFKFRTMIHAPNSPQPGPVQEINGAIMHKFYDDPRVTRAGRYLRRTSLDELPQLLNILKGDMSLVGPRPELPWLVDKYQPWQRKRFEVPQGLTGWWQVNGRSDKPMHLHTEEDLYYIKHYSLWLDLQILWRTVKAVINRRGAF